MTTARCLVDVSVWRRLDDVPMALHLLAKMLAGQVATCTLIDAEVASWAAAESERQAIRLDRRHWLTWLPCPEAAWERAAAVFTELSGSHVIGFETCLVAAIAEHHGCTLWHCDPALSAVAAVTQQPIELGRPNNWDASEPNLGYKSSAI